MYLTLETICSVWVIISAYVFIFIWWTSYTSFSVFFLTWNKFARGKATGLKCLIWLSNQTKSHNLDHYKVRMTRFYTSLKILYIHGHQVLWGYFNLQIKIEKHYDQLDWHEIYPFSFTNWVWSTVHCPCALVYCILMQFDRYRMNYHHVQFIKNFL